MAAIAGSPVDRYASPRPRADAIATCRVAEDSMVAGELPYLSDNSSAISGPAIPRYGFVTKHSLKRFAATDLRRSDVF